MTQLKNFLLNLTVLISISSNILSQQTYNIKRFSFTDSTQTEMELDFKLISNLIVIPIHINDSDTLNFILDTGLRFTILSLLPNGEDITFEYVSETTISGLGEEEDSKAWITYGNSIRIKDIIGEFSSLYVLDRDRFNLSSQMGIEINGLIGYELFESFIIEIDYVNEKIKFYSPDKFTYKKKHSKWASYPIEIYNNKPYILLPVTFFNDSTVNTKLLIDNGSSDALWLFPNTNSNIIYPSEGKEFYLGQGLNGNIYGKQSRVKNVQIGKNVLENVTASFPDTSSVRFSLLNDVQDRNGSIGSEVFRRFTVFIDYTNKKILFKPNSNFSDEFNFNLSGIEITSPFIGVPYFQISQVRDDSPADAAGVEVGDQIIKINNIFISSYTFNDVINLFHSKEGRKIKLKLMRNGELVKTSFKLNEL